MKGNRESWESSGEVGVRGWNLAGSGGGGELEFVSKSEIELPGFVMSVVKCVI
jgi:hypothetical protein